MVVLAAEEGYIITLEEQEGGIRVELVLITPSSTFRQITSGVPVEVEVVPTIMVAVNQIPRG
jgi:hypothetical protein